MAKRTAVKGCFLLLFVIVVVVIAIVAWQVLSNDNGKGSSLLNGGLFGNGNESQAPIDTGTVGTLSPTHLRPSSPIKSPTMAPTNFEYPFNQCAPNASQCCNGLENLCSYPVNEMLFGMVHNAYSTTVDGFLFPNNEKRFDKALQAGFRGINFDICVCSGEFKLCHGACGVGEVDPTQAFTNLATFLKENPNEVVVLTMELNNGVNLTDFNNQILNNIDGFSNLLYIHPNVTDAWPTLGTLIEADTRLIAFHLNGPNCETEGQCPPGLYWYFASVMESEFELASIKAILDSKTSCVVTRGASSSNGAFYAVNNFITTGTYGTDVPKKASMTANSYDFARNRIQACQSLAQPGLPGNTNVNFLFVDYWSFGDIVQVVQEYNKNLGAYTHGNNTAG